LTLGSSEEDHTKTNEDCILSHSSANNKVDIELKLSTNVTKKTLENKILKSPPSLRPSEDILLFLNTIVCWI